MMCAHIEGSSLRLAVGLVVVCRVPFDKSPQLRGLLDRRGVVYSSSARLLQRIRNSLGDSLARSTGLIENAGLGTWLEADASILRNGGHGEGFD